MNSGRAKKIKRMLESEGMPDRLFNKTYKDLKKGKHKRNNSIPKKVLKTKRHEGECVINFKERRKKANERKREKRKSERLERD